MGNCAEQALIFGREPWTTPCRGNTGAAALKSFHRFSPRTSAHIRLVTLTRCVRGIGPVLWCSGALVFWEVFLVPMSPSSILSLSRLTLLRLLPQLARLYRLSWDIRCWQLDLILLEGVNTIPPPHGLRRLMSFDDLLFDFSISQGNRRPGARRHGFRGGDKEIAPFEIPPRLKREA